MRKLFPLLIVVFFTVACTPAATPTTTTIDTATLAADEAERLSEDEVYIHVFENVHARFWAASIRADRAQTVEEMTGPIAQLNGINRELKSLDVPVGARQMHDAAVEFMGRITAANQNFLDAGEREERTRLYTQGYNAFAEFEARRDAYYGQLDSSIYEAVIFEIDP